jgi:hypothetical protein
MSQQFFELIRPDHNFDFVGKTKPLLISSAILIVLSFLMLPLNMIIPGRGHALNFAIDFRGGTEMRVDFSKDVTPERSFARRWKPVATRDSEVVHAARVQACVPGSLPGCLGADTRAGQACRVGRCATSWAKSRCASSSSAMEETRPTFG